MALPEPLPQITQAFVSDLAATLRSDLVGVYAYGSAISGGFDPAASDLDLCVVTARPTDELDLDVLQGLVDRIAARAPDWAERRDIVFVGRSTLATFREGGPLVSISHDEPLERFDHAEDWLQTWYLVRTAAVALAGPPADGVIPPISTAEFTAAVTRHTLGLTHAATSEERPGPLSYVLLTLCRVLYLLETGEQVPKRAAAAWARERWPGSEPAIRLAVEVSAVHGDRHLSGAERTEIRRSIADLASELAARTPSG